MAAVLFLHLLPGLPEEQVGADGGPENRHQRHRVILVEGEMRHHDIENCGVPRHIGHQDHPGIGKQRKRGPFKHALVLLIAQHHFERDADQPDGDGEGQHWPRHDQRHHRAHRAQVCAQIDDVGDQQQHHHRAQQPPRIVFTHILGNAHAGGRADPRADRLDRDEQRKAKKHRPGQPEPELRAHLAVSADARWIIIRRPGYQPGPQHLQWRAAFGPIGHGTASALIAAWTRASTSARGSPGGIGSEIR